MIVESNPYLERWARVLVGYCLRISEDDLFEIQAGPGAWPLVRSVYRQALRAGAHPFVTTRNDDLEALLVDRATERQLDFVSPIERFVVDAIDARLVIQDGEGQNHATVEAVAERAGRRERALAPLRAAFRERSGHGALRRCTTLYPTAGGARAAGMPVPTLERLIVGACFLDAEDPLAVWNELFERQQRLVDVFEGASVIHVTAANGTDIRFGVSGRTWVNGRARRNFPSGEVFTGPLEDEVDGEICFSFPGRHEGLVVDGIRLTFEGGRVTRAEAASNEGSLHRLLALDGGSSRVGEVAIGTNYRIDRPIGNTLIDEKIGGTMHMALGAGYPETGSRVRSQLHWDLIVDLRQGGRVRADGRDVLVDGRIVVPGW